MSIQSGQKAIVKEDCLVSIQSGQKAIVKEGSLMSIQSGQKAIVKERCLVSIQSWQRFCATPPTVRKEKEIQQSFIIWKF